MPMTIFEVAEVDFGTQIVPRRTTIVTNLELQARAVVHLVIGIDIRYPEREQIADTGLYFQFRVFRSTPCYPCRLIVQVGGSVYLRVKESEITAFVRSNTMIFMPESGCVVGYGISA